ncbi:MAG: CotH kinase family protein, partial [Prevotella sp.]|nr:CotH kinase family protein [Prevotella sp.]
LTTNADAQTTSKLVINELMQSNIDCIMDDLHEFPDSWVELYNNSDESINLKEYQIGIKEGNAWQLPNKTIDAKGFIVVYCDKEEWSLHTDFRLDTGKGCVVYLFKGNEVVDSLPAALPKMPAPNIAYGRKTDGGNEWGYQLTPTPGTTNCGEVCDEKHILGEPVFSEPGHVLTSSKKISLALSLPKDAPEGTQIYYTTDGKEPTKDSKLYTKEISINDSYAIRAKLFCDGWLSPRSTVQSYIFLDRNMTIPVVSITTNDDYLNGKEGIFTKNTSKSNPINWRRPINFEMFVEPDKASVLNQICETRVMGGQSREWARKSMAIYANKRFSAKRLEYEFFPDQKPGVTNFKSIMLRNGGNDFQYDMLRDAVIQRTMGQNADLDWQAWRPAAIYINGEYHCLLNIRERSNDDNIFTNYDGLEDIDMMEIAQENSKVVGELKAGTEDNYDEFVKFYSETDHTLAEYAEWMDWEEYINLMVMNLYFNNQDFPGNNIVMWRPRTEDGKWRWISKDTDFGLGLYGKEATFNTIKWIYDPKYDRDRSWANTEEATRLFRHLMEDPDFNREFIDHCFIYMGDFLNEKSVCEIFDSMYELVYDELLVHKNELNPPSPWGWGWGGSNEDNIKNDAKSIRDWLSKRDNAFIKQMADFYKLGTAISMTINKDVEGAEDTGICFNGVKLTKGTFDGKFFQDRAITLEGDPESDKVVTGWKIVTNGSNTEEVQGSRLEMVMPQCTSLAITALIETNGIRTISNETTKAQDIYDLNGRKVRSGSTSLEGLPRGIYIVGGKKVIKTQ